MFVNDYEPIPKIEFLKNVKAFISIFGLAPFSPETTMTRYQIYCIYLFIVITLVSSSTEEEEAAKLAGFTVQQFYEVYDQTIHKPLTNLVFWDAIVHFILWIAELIW